MAKTQLLRFFTLYYHFRLAWATKKTLVLIRTESMQPKINIWSLAAVIAAYCFALKCGVQGKYAAIVVNLR